MIYALHGAVGMAADWKPLARAMKQVNQPVARVDLWQFLACCPMPISEFGAAFNKEVHATDPVLLGYSMGGRLALHALIADPTKWSKAVIISAHTGIAKEDLIPRQAHDAAWAAKALKGEWDTFLAEWNAQGVLSGTSMPDRRTLQPRREAVARSFMDWTVGVQENLLPQLEKVTCPVLWVVGENDTKFLKVARAAVDVLPNAQLRIIPGCGHRVPWEKPAEFTSAVREFLAE
ncbi:MAG: alpha/beta fold hydrolase [Rubritalea sp.]|uniref:alpha/beta fold hydrolase n=1 Tax=Rubritalea sp. TaxID=2109375 RepID=UPI003241D2D7